MRITLPSPSNHPALGATPAPAVAPLTPRVRIAARGGDPLPSFPDARAYQNYVINLVGQARQLEKDIETAQKASGDRPADPTTLALRERLDAVKLQLKILRDDMPIPSSWSRSGFLGGQGFDKEEFWREQVEAIPGKAVVVTPAPQKPAAAAPAPASLPAVPTVPPVALPAEPNTPQVASTLRMALIAHNQGMSSTASDGFKQALSACRTAQDAMAVFKVASSRSYSTAAGNAVAVAAQLSPDYATAIAVAETAAAASYSTGAGKAYDAARGLARTSTEALQVAISAASRSFSTAAGHAFDRATQLAATSAEALQVSEQASKRSYSSSASRAMKRALSLP